MASDFIVELYQDFVKKKGTIKLDVFRRYLQIRYNVNFTPTTLKDHLKTH